MMIHAAPDVPIFLHIFAENHLYITHIYLSSPVRPYSLTGQVLEEVMDAKYLGVTLSDDLDWSKHIATMTTKANSKLSFLRATRRAAQRSLSKLPTFL